MRTYTSMVAVALGVATQAVAQCERWFRLDPASTLAPHTNMAMVYDTQLDLTVFYNGAVTLARETWTWNGEAWQLLARGGPSALNYHAMAYDAARENTVLFGGINGSQMYNQTWLFDGAGWSELPLSTRPSRRWFHAMAYDSRRGVTVLFGGHDGDSTEFGDTWEFDGQAWRQVATTGPSPRYAHAMAYDANRGVTVLHGGFRFPTTFDETWEWDGVSWTLVTTGGPEPRASHKMVYDERRRECLIFGGSNSAQQRWTWAWNGSVWRIADQSGPPPRGDHAMAYDSLRGRTVLFGGRFGTPIYGDTWEYGLYPDCDQTTGAGELDIFDFLCFLNKFVAQEPYACDCDTSTGPGVCDVFDFLCFQDLFAGCP